MAGINKVIIVGRLGNNPELKTLSPGNMVTTFSVATSESWVKDGQKQERTEWHRVVVWGKQAENCAKYLSKGRQVYVEGKLQTRQWEDQQGQKKYSTEVVAQNVQFLGSTSENATTTSSSQNEGFEAQDFGPEPKFDANDEIPF
ncbi:MAG: single-stranded DNA-binding protein [Deltaproteobacteria bacterium]|jgi:single-strand DNA-binding protein|nr:single-stranded DNA-binding protein [Deltaproteobacteria bacterium]